MEGESLEARLLRTLRLEAAEACRVILDAAAGLGALHRAGIIHRDVKPANLLLRASDGRTLVADAGLSWRIDGHGLDRVRGGTVGYASPEQLACTDAPDTLSDVYGLAATAYRTLTGTPAFPYTRAECRQAQRRSPAPPSVWSGRLAPFDELFRQALSPDPRSRFETIAELEEALSHALAEVCSLRRSYRYVLIVDDDLDMRAVVHACVRSVAAELEVRCAVDGAGALRSLCAEPPALLLLDLDLPGCNGLEVLATLRGNDATRALPVVVVSGMAGANEESVCRRLGVSALVTKPVDPPVLARAIRYALGGGPTLPKAWVPPRPEG